MNCLLTVTLTGEITDTITAQTEQKLFYQYQEISKNSEQTQTYLNFINKDRRIPIKYDNHVMTHDMFELLTRVHI